MIRKIAYVLVGALAATAFLLPLRPAAADPPVFYTWAGTAVAFSPSANFTANAFCDEGDSRVSYGFQTTTTAGPPIVEDPFYLYEMKPFDFEGAEGALIRGYSPVESGYAQVHITCMTN